MRCYRTKHLFSSSVNRGLTRQGFKNLEICTELLERFSWPYLQQMYNRCYGGLAACHTMDLNNAHVFSGIGLRHTNTIDRTLEMHKLTDLSQ